MNTHFNMTEQSLPNGLPQQFGKPNPMSFNGVDSSNSSRTSSPANRLQQIPVSQLPPSRSTIPASQLPPGGIQQGANVNQLMQNCANLSISQITPVSSPKVQAFSTSTPVLNAIKNGQPLEKSNDHQQNLNKNRDTSPIISSSTIQNTFMHSAQSHFTNVPLKSNSGPQNDSNMILSRQQQPAPKTQQSSSRLLMNVPNLKDVPLLPSKENVLYSNQSSYIGKPPQPNLQPLAAINQNVTPVIPPGPFNTRPNPLPPNKVQPNPYLIQQQTMPQRLPPQNPLQIQQPPQNLTNSQQNFKTNLHTNRYPMMTQQYPNSPTAHFQNISAPQQQQQHRQQDVRQNYNQQANVVQSGFNQMWGQENYDLLQCPNVLPPMKIEPPKICLGQDFLDAANCSPHIFRCTMTKIPESSSLLQKSRLPLGILIHPFKDLDHLPVIQCSTIVRCRTCRTYINPFVFFIDMKRWKCNLCYRVNELPEEFQFDPVSKTYGDPSRRPEIKSSTIEYIAPSEYMLRPPQPAVYLFLLDVSHGAIESGYLQTICNVLTSNLSNLPGDSRTQIGFVAYNSFLHFYSLAEGLNQPHEMTVLDIDDVFLPCPDNLIVNLQERKDLIADLLAQLPTRFNASFDMGSALGAALQAAHKMIASTGGRITVFQASLPMIGPGALIAREDPSQRAGAEVNHLNPANDFYKRLALECSGQQIAVDLFIVNSQYVDLATLSGISRFSGGCIHHFPLFKASHTLQAENLERTLKRYLTRKIGFEAVMRIRCTRGLSIHTFHGNFFVRSTDLLSLPNVNPEAGFGMQVAIDECLSDLHTVCFQAALLYTSSKGERRIRVHTLCVPIASTLPDVLAAADQQCIVGLLAKMAVDRSMQSSLSDAREAFINVAIDILSSYKLTLNVGNASSGLMAPQYLKLLPLYISALLKHLAFRSGTSTRLDDRIKAMCDMKSLPLYLLIQQIYPDLYPVHNLEDQPTIANVDGEVVSQPPRLQLSARNLDSKGAFLMDMGELMVLLVGSAVSQTFLNEALGVQDYNSITEQMYDLPNLDTPHNQRLNNFINHLNDEKPFVASLHIIRENSLNRSIFIEHLIEDRIETALSYHEFLQHLKTQVK